MARFCEECDHSLHFHRSGTLYENAVTAPERFVQASGHLFEIAPFEDVVGRHTAVQGSGREVFRASLIRNQCGQANSLNKVINYRLIHLISGLRIPGRWCVEPRKSGRSDARFATRARTALQSQVGVASKKTSKYPWQKETTTTTAAHSRTC